MLDTISKAYWGMIFKRITPEWERLGFFNDEQFGSRRGTSVTTPLAIATALSELAYADHVPFLAVSQDISKAYDSVPIRLGVEVALRRFGLPEEFIEHYLNSHRGNRAVSATAYGASDSILGDADGTFSFTRGVPQGATESPFCWIAFYSILILWVAQTHSSKGKTHLSVCLSVRLSVRLSVCNDILKIILKGSRTWTERKKHTESDLERKVLKFEYDTEGGREKPIYFRLSVRNDILRERDGSE